MTGFDIRGGCEGQSLRLYGEFTGYNTGATMQVGLWITNDGEHIGQARYRAVQYGSAGLADRLLHIMANDWHNRPGTAAAQVYDMFQDGTYRKEEIDWAQICYDLIGDEPDQDDLSRAAEEIERDLGRVADPTEVFARAQQWRELWASETALGFGGKR